MSVKAKKRKQSLKEKLFILSLVIWPIAHFCLFWVYVNFSTFLSVFQTYRPALGEYVWSGTGDLEKAFKDMVLGDNPLLNRAMWNSVFSISVNLVIILPLAFITAFAFYKHVKGEKIFRVIFYVPSMISLVVLTMCYKYMFDPSFGPISSFFEDVLKIEGLQWLAPTLNNNLVWPLIYLFCVWAGLGANVILMSGAMQRIPKEIGESAKLEGIGFFREAWSIVLPLIMPTVSNFIVLAVMGMFGFMLQPMLLTNKGGGAEGKTLTVALQIFNLVDSGRVEHGKLAATYGILFSAIFGPLVFIAKLVLDKITPKVEF